MRYNEFQINEDNVKAKLKERYPHLTEEQLDEILPALGAVAGRIGAGAAKMGAKAVGAGVKAAGRVGAQMGKAAAKGAANMAKGAVKSAANKLANKAMGKVADKAVGKMAQQVLKKGATLPMPDAQGKEQEFEIDDVKGNEITLKNPKVKPGEPIKTVHNKKDLDPIIKQLAGL
jgi:hypothetical protein